MSARKQGRSSENFGQDWAVIMAGGKGSRFWPESRARHPKPFLSLVGSRALLEETVARLVPLIPPSRIFIVLQKELVGKARRLLPQIPRQNILGEPIGRNTAPCAAWAATHVARKDPDARIVFLPADSYIRPKSLFQRALKRAFALVDEKPVLFGIRPRGPNPAYGYLEVKRGKVIRFHEKPSLSKARKFLKRGNFFWNSGIFVWRLDAFAKALKKYLPKVYSAFRLGGGGVTAGARLGQRGTGSNASLTLFARLPAVSLDYGIMEQLKDCHFFPAPFAWSDLGGWTSLAEFWPLDSRKNRIQGKTLLIRSDRNIVKANDRLVVLVGVQDLVVVETRDALLVCHQKEAEGIRHVVSELERRKAWRHL